MAYDLQPLSAPRATGALLRTFVTLVESGATSALLSGKLFRDAGFEALRNLPADEPLDPRHPVFHCFPRHEGDPQADAQRRDAAALAARLPAAPTEGFAFETVADFVAAYRSKHTDPLAVAERALAMVAETEQQEPAMRIFIAQHRDEVLGQAEASAARWQAGAPMGPLDGVPVAIKDEVDMAGYPTTVGTRFLGVEPASADAETVARLRAAGALLLGKANMHEIGLGVTGLNPHHGAARNPYDPARATGGSSSGPAAAVASGLCPLALGADGGGSIRIPASLCGLVGLKPTYGRVSEHGAAPLCWSVAHLGPIGATVRDVALGYAVLAGPDPKDATSLLQPAADFSGLERRDLGGLRLGFYPAWLESAEPVVVERTRTLLRALEHAGAELREVEIPELGVLRTVHFVTIISEMATAHAQHYREHRRDYGLDTRLNLALARKLAAFDYLHAQRHRARLCRHFARVLAEVDAIVTPTTGRTAPELPVDALQTGESNLALTEQIMRFAPAANLTGLPAITVPSGYDEQGLPIGLHVIGRAWQENVLLRIAAAAEQQLVRQAPRVHLRYLS